MYYIHIVYVDIVLIYMFSDTHYHVCIDIRSRTMSSPMLVDDVSIIIIHLVVNKIPDCNDST